MKRNETKPNESNRIESKRNQVAMFMFRRPLGLLRQHRYADLRLLFGAKFLTKLGENNDNNNSDSDKISYLTEGQSSALNWILYAFLGATSRQKWPSSAVRAARLGLLLLLPMASVRPLSPGQQLRRVAAVCAPL